MKNSSNKNRHSLLWTALATVAICGVVQQRAQAADVFWTNATGDGVYTNTANWNPPVLPQTTDYSSDVVVFGEQGGTPHVVERLNYGNPSWATTPNLCHLRFDTAGWTFNSGSNIKNLKVVKSFGAGTNTVGFLWEQQGSQTWVIGSGNTLYLEKAFYCRASEITIVGGGTLHLASWFTGFGGDYVYGLILQDVTVRVDAARPAQVSNGKVWLNSSSAKLQLKTTVADARNIIDIRVYDNIGSGITVTDIGDSYVEMGVADWATVIEIH